MSLLRTSGFIFPLLLFLVLSRVYYNKEAKALEHNSRSHFLSYSEKNLLTLQTRMNEKKQILQAYIAFFRSSDFVSLDEFTLFSRSLSLHKDNYRVCWKSSVGKKIYASQEITSSLCEGVNLLDRSELIDNATGDTQVMLSEFVATEAGRQKGVVYLFFPLKEITENQNWDPSRYNDKVLAINRVSNEIKTVHDSHGGSADHSNNNLYQKVFQIGSFDIYYNSQLKEGESLRAQKRRITLLSYLVFVIGLLVTFYIRNLVNKNSDIRKIVKKQIFELERSNEKLSAVNEELNQFAYRTSHDLKAPLISSQKLIKFIIEDIGSRDFDEVKANSLKVQRMMEQQESLINDILLMVRSEMDSEGREQILISEMVNDIKTKLQGLLIDSQCIVVNEVGEMRPTLNRVRFSQVLENLISNGIKYRDLSKEKQFVKIRAQKDNMALKVIVEDNGLGIPEKYKADVYKMFKRFHPKVSFGSGLGMSIAKKNVEYMNGKIEFQSSASGTVFTVEIPDAFS